MSLIVGTDNVLKFGDVTIHGIIANESGTGIGTMYASMTVGLIPCLLAEALVMVVR